jgi:hypothetical protein
LSEDGCRLSCLIPRELLWSERQIAGRIFTVPLSSQTRLHLEEMPTQKDRVAPKLARRWIPQPSRSLRQLQIPVERGFGHF